MYRAGCHSFIPGPIADQHRRQNLDWFDLSFGRGTAKQEDFPEVLLHDFDWDAWKATQRSEDIRVPFQNVQASSDSDRRARIVWALGQAPDKIQWDGQYTILKDEEWIGRHSGEQLDEGKIANTARMPISFGENTQGQIYYNPTINKPVPVVIWLHPYSHSHGYSIGYTGNYETTKLIYYRLAMAGSRSAGIFFCSKGVRWARCSLEKSVRSVSPQF